MFLPVGLIVRAIGAAHDYHVESSMAAEANWLDQEREMARGRAFWDACVGPDACLLALGHVDWSACVIDGIRVEAPSTSPNGGTTGPSQGGYRGSADLLGRGPHGLVGVPAGRHVIETRTGDRVSRTSVAIYPREALCLRCDPSSGAWAPYEKAECDAIVARVADGSAELLHYATSVADPLLRARRARTSAEAGQECMQHVKQTLAHILAGDEAKAAGSAMLAGGALLGAPIPSFEPVTTFVGFNAFELIGRNEPRKAWLLLQAGLSILPENPTLLAILGEIQISAGARDDGRLNLERALAREAGLDPRMTERTRALLAS